MCSLALWVICIGMGVGFRMIYEYYLTKHHGDDVASNEYKISLDIFFDQFHVSLNALRTPPSAHQGQLVAFIDFECVCCFICMNGANSVDENL